MAADPIVSKLVQVARLYYVYNLNQQQIADKLGISRPGVSRLLQEARDKGIVHIEIVDIEGIGAGIEKSLQEKFSLKKAVIVPMDGVTDDSELKERLGIAAAHVIDEFVREGTVLGVAWGSTMQELVQHLQPRRVKNMTVVQLIGGIARAEFDTHASEIAQKMSENYKAIPYLLPLPNIVDDVRVKQAMMSDKHITKVLDLGRRAEIAVFSVGRLTRDCLMCKAEYFHKDEVDALLANNAVGDICSHVITDTGGICSSDLDARTIGIELDELKKKKIAIAVAGGHDKLPVIRAALLGRYFNVLVTDEKVAVALLEAN
jgi:deoxyribonucleoside regulator